MSNINQKRLDQMIENAISHKQDLPLEGISSWFVKFKKLLSKPIITTMTLTTLVIVTTSLIPARRYIFAADVEEMYDVVMLDIFDDV